MKNFRLLLIFSLLFTSSLFAQPGTVLLNHDFEASDDGWVAGGSVGGAVFNKISDPFGVGSNCWAINPFNSYGNYDGAYVTTGAIDMSNYADMTFSIDIRYNTEKNWDGFTIFYSTDNFVGTMDPLGAQGEGTNWYVSQIDGVNDRYTEVASDPDGWSGDNGAWATASLPIPAALEGSPTVYFSVYFGSDGSVQDVGVAFDNVNITGTYTAPCSAPSGPVASAITTTTATLTWVEASPAASDGYDYYYTTSATAPNGATTPSGSVAAGVVTDDLTGLTPGMTYYFYVRSDCGLSTYSDWTSGGTFTCTALSPTITSFTPSEGCANETVVVITGTNLGGVTAVLVGGVNTGSINVDSDTQITYTVGIGNTGVIQVYNPAGNAASTGTFTFNSSASVDTHPIATLDVLVGNQGGLRCQSASASGYQWQYSGNNAIWGNVADGTPANVTYAFPSADSLTIIPSLDAAAATVYYRCVLSCGSVQSTSSAVTFVTYCDAGGGTLSGISGVTFGSMLNTGTAYTDQYTDYSSTLQQTVYRDSTYALDVFVNTGGNYTNYQKVWFDWDANGSFEDAGEEYDLGFATNVTDGSSSLCPLNIVVPSDATEGNVKMRVLSRYGTSASTSCATGIDGEVEDYAINIRFPYMWTGATSTAWEDKSNWNGEVSPVYTSLVIVPDVVNQPDISSIITLEELRNLWASSLTVSSSSLTVSGAIDNDGTLIIGNATVNADADFDGTTGTIDMTDDNANLVVSSTVTSLGTLDETQGTVTYDGIQQNVLADTYFGLSISTTGIKTASGNLDVNGDLTTAASTDCRLDMGANDLTVGGNLTVGAQNGIDLGDAAASLTFDGTADQTITHAGSAVVSAGATVTADFETGSDSWVAGPSATFPWTRDSGGTGSSGTGPSTGASGSFYYYTEATGGSTSDDDYLTQTFDFTSYASPQISFYYHMYGASMGTLYLEVNTGGGWSSIFSISGQQHTSYGAAWTQQIVDLSSYGFSASVQIRFHGERGSGYQSDMAIDVIEISDNAAPGTDYDFYDVTISKPSGNVILGSAVDIDRVLTLTTGYIDASSIDLTFAPNGTVTGGSDASHVIGTVVKTTESTSKFTFPLGDGTYYKSIAITPSAATSNVWTAQYFNTVHSNSVMETPDLDHVSAYEYWDLDNGAGLSGIMEIPWVPQNAVLEYADLRIAHYDGSTDWDMVASTPTGTNSSGAIVSDTWVTDYSPFTIGSTTATNVLPITLVSFSGEKKENKNILNWTTASEINNAYFTIEKSYNGLDFDWVGTQEGSSPSTQIINYSLTDYNILERINYYRLKQTDFDGKFVYSNTISIDNRNDYSFKEIIGKTNLLGQKVDENYNGIVIVQYKDGTSRKYYQFK